MTDAITNSTTPLPARQATGGSRLYGSESVREVRSRAAFTQQGQSGEERAGIERLNRLAAGGVRLDPNAPRGFYLNIRV